VVILFAADYLVHARSAKIVIPQFHCLTFREGRGSPEARDLGTPANAGLLSVSSKGDLAILTRPFDPDTSSSGVRPEKL
jgi:hypothetical protein